MAVKRRRRRYAVPLICYELQIRWRAKPTKGLGVVVAPGQSVAFNAGTGVVAFASHAAMTFAHLRYRRALSRESGAGGRRRKTED